MFTHLGMLLLSALVILPLTCGTLVYIMHIQMKVFFDILVLLKNGGWSSFFSFIFPPPEATDITILFSYSPEKVNNSLT